MKTPSRAEWSAFLATIVDIDGRAIAAAELTYTRRPDRVIIYCDRPLRPDKRAKLMAIVEKISPGLRCLVKSP